MNSKLERALKGEIGLHVIDKDTWDRLMVFYEDNGLLWQGSDKAPTDEQWEVANKDYCVDAGTNLHIDFHGLDDRYPRSNVEELSEEDFDDDNKSKDDAEQLYVLLTEANDTAVFNERNYSVIFTKEDLVNYFGTHTDYYDKNANVYPIGKPMKMNITYELKEVKG